MGLLIGKLDDERTDAYAEGMPDERTHQLRRLAIAESKKRVADHLAEQRKSARVEADMRGVSAAHVLARGRGHGAHADCRRVAGIAGAIANKGLVLSRLSEAEVWLWPGLALQIPR